MANCFSPLAWFCLQWFRKGFLTLTPEDLNAADGAGKGQAGTWRSTRGKTPRVLMEKCVHPVRLTGFGTKSRVFAPEGALAQTATSEGVF